MFDDELFRKEELSPKLGFVEAFEHVQQWGRVEDDHNYQNMHNSDIFIKTGSILNTKVL